MAKYLFTVLLLIWVCRLGAAMPVADQREPAAKQAMWLEETEKTEKKAEKESRNGFEGPADYLYQASLPDLPLFLAQARITGYSKPCAGFPVPAFTPPDRSSFFR